MITSTNAFAPVIVGPGLVIVVLAGATLISGIPFVVQNTPVSVIANATNFVYLDFSSGNLVANTSGFPSQNVFPIAKVVTSASGVILVTDVRADYAPLGSGGGGSGVGPYNVTNQNSNYTAFAWDFVRCDTSGGGFTVTLPDATLTINKEINIKKISTDSNAVTLNTTAGQTIDSQASGFWQIVSSEVSMLVISNGVNWDIV
jgi:hypothetical protein